MKKKFIAYGLLLVSCLCLLVVGIVTVLATTQREVDAGLFVRFTAEDVDGSVTMYYRIGGSGNWIKNGETIVFNAEDNDNQARTTDLTLDSAVTKSSKYVEFKYEFVNTGSKYYTATMMLETTQRENISLTYKYNDPTETKEYDDFKYAVVVPGETDASNAKTYFIKVGMEDLSRSANFSGTFNWILKGYNLVNNEELVLTTLDYVETNVAGTYSAKYNGSPLEDNTLIIPSKLGDSPVTTVGECEGTLPANTKIVVSEGVTNIGSSAFQGQTGLTEIKLPASLITIDTSAFRNCTNLTSLTFPENSKLTTIGNYAFGDSSLENVVFPDSLENIKQIAFYKTRIESITIPASVTTIEMGAFGSTGNLKSIVVAEGNTCFEMRGNCLIEKSTGRLIQGFDDSVIPDDGTIKIIDGYSFMYRTHFNPGYIPEGVTTIGQYAFCAASAIINLTLPQSLTTIGESAFHVTNITSIKIPKNVTRLVNPFTTTRSLLTIEVDEENSKFHSNGNCLIETATKTLIAGCQNSVIPSDGTVEVIGRNAFLNQSNLESIVIPETVKTLVFTAFAGCTGLTEINIPSSVERIDSGVFSNCTALNSVSLTGENWQVSTTLNGAYESIPSTYDLTDSSVVANLFKTTYSNYYWKRI